MDYLCKLVVGLEGSLKAEHGTGRNVAPYVEMEWGAKATGIMWELKRLFDPQDLLNPGVVLNKDNKVSVLLAPCLMPRASAPAMPPRSTYASRMRTRRSGPVRTSGSVADGLAARHGVRG